MSLNAFSSLRLVLLSGTKKIKILPQLFKKLLITDADYGGPLTTMTGHIVLFIFAIFIQGMELTSDQISAMYPMGITVWIYFYCSFLLFISTYMSPYKFFHKKCGSKVNSIANIICLFLGILFEKSYEESLASLYAAFLFAIFFLIILILVRPSTDLGFFGFILGIIGSIGYNLFGLRINMWIVIGICFLLFCFKGWLDKNWIEEYKARDSAFFFSVKANELIEPPSFEHDQLLRFTTSSTEIMFSTTLRVVYRLKSWLSRIEEDRLKLHNNANDVEDVVPLVTMSEEENQLYNVATELLILTNPERNQRLPVLDNEDGEAVVAAICYLIFYFKWWLGREYNLGQLFTSERDEDFSQANVLLPVIPTTNLDEDQLEFLRITNNLGLQKALHSAEQMRFALQAQALVNFSLIMRIGAFRKKGDMITMRFIIVFSSISSLLFTNFLFNLIKFLPQFKLNLSCGRYLRRGRR